MPSPSHPSPLYLPPPHCVGVGGSEKGGGIRGIQGEPNTYPLVAIILNITTKSQTFYPLIQHLHKHPHRQVTIKTQMSTNSKITSEILPKCPEILHSHAQFYLTSFTQSSLQTCIHTQATTTSQTSHMHSYTIPTKLDTLKTPFRPFRLQLDSVPEPYIYPLLRPGLLLPPKQRREVQ